jgi:hypothetical protein
VRVGTAAELTDALAAAGPGTVIRLADGVYSGTFTANRSGTAAAPVFLCGSPAAILDGGSVTGGYVLHLESVAHWRVSGFEIRNGQKGVILDSATDVGLQDLTVRQIGDEAVHLRRNSTGNVVRGLRISGTGQRRDKFGEGIYVGSAESNWCEITGCQPDRSDRNAVLENTITGTTSESVDIKEGTSGGILAGNSFDGTGMTAADSWVDVKGNGWLITGNRGVVSTKDGFRPMSWLTAGGTRTCSPATSPICVAAAALPSTCTSQGATGSPATTRRPAPTRCPTIRAPGLADRGLTRPGAAPNHPDARPDNRRTRMSSPRLPRLTVIGTGYLGATHAACMASLGFEVLGVDVDEDKVRELAAGRLPFFEPGLQELVRKGVDEGLLRFTTSLAEAAEFGDVHFLCVGTPQQRGSAAADLSFVDAAVEGLAPNLRRPALLVGKSTVPVGTAERLAARLAELAPAGDDAELAWNPEFLREGFAVEDTLRPDRLVFGVAPVRAEGLLRQVFAPVLELGTPLVVTDLATAQR